MFFTTPTRFPEGTTRNLRVRLALTRSGNPHVLEGLQLPAERWREIHRHFARKPSATSHVSPIERASAAAAEDCQASPVLAAPSLGRPIICQKAALHLFAEGTIGFSSPAQSRTDA